MQGTPSLSTLLEKKTLLNTSKELYLDGLPVQTYHWICKTELRKSLWSVSVVAYHRISVGTLSDAQVWGGVVVVDVIDLCAG